MNFVHPEMLYLAPLVALPIIIHLLNRVRYRRVRWAAIDFLLTTEQRAVRRARIRQWLLMAMRMLLLAAILMALAQPIFSGGLAELLGSSSQVAVVIDNSPSMSAKDAGGQVLERGVKMATEAIEGLPGSARLTLGTTSGQYESPFRQPMQAQETVLKSLGEVRLKAGLDDMAGAIKGAAESLERGGGGGMIWLVTDMRAAGWNSGGEGAWQAAREALARAGRPRLVISALTPSLTVNRCIERVRVEPEILLEGDVPRMTAAIRSTGVGGTISVRLHCDGKLIDTRSIQMNEAGTAEVVFQLPAVQAGPQTGYLELDPRDNVPEDDIYHFVIRPSEALPVLIVDSRPDVGRFSRDGDFLSLALSPPQTATSRSPFKVSRVEAARLADETLERYQGVLLSEASRLDAGQVERLKAYVREGGWLMIFPGSTTEQDLFNRLELTPARLGRRNEAPQGGQWRIGFVGTSPIVKWLPEAGLEMMLVKQAFDLQAGDQGEVLLALDSGQPMLVRSQAGKGRIYTWSVSSGLEFSKLPMWMLLPIVHASLLEHVVETGSSLAIPAFRRLDLPGQVRLARVVTPSGEALPLTFPDENPADSYFAGTQQAGIYRLALSEKAEDLKSAPAVAAVNVPLEESSLELIDVARINQLIGYPVIHLKGDRDINELEATDKTASAASGFPLAALGLALLLTEAVMAWTMSRPRQSGNGA